MEELNILNFLPAYPNINEYTENELNPYSSVIEDPPKVFATALYKKKEFYDERLLEEEEMPGVGEPYKHQKIIARFLSSHTIYDQILLLHEMGSGKTCSAIGAIELIRKERSSFTGAMIFASGESLLQNFVNELVFRCTKNEYIPEGYEDLSVMEKVHRINKNVRNYYNLNTFEVFAKTIKKMTDENIVEKYSNKIIVIDEVHNIRIQDEIQKEMLRMYQQFWRFLHRVKNCKIILMSGTPMKDNPEEIASVMNLILPENEQLPVKRYFLEEFFNIENDLYDIKKEKMNELKSKFKGRVSYLKAMHSTVRKVFDGRVIKGLKHFKIFTDKMSEFQRLAYIRAWEEDKNIQRGIYVSSRQAILFVFPDGTYGREGFDNQKWIKKDENKKFLKGKSGIKSKYKLSDEFKEYFRGKNTDQKLDVLNKFSSKYAMTIRSIINAYNDNKLSFVYCEFVKGSGCILFSLILELFDFSKATGMEKENNQKLRYALITNETATSKQVRTIIDRFNKTDNVFGKIINVIIGSRVISEGFSLRNIQEEHIITPHWNYSETAQAIARGWRLGSHKDLLDAGINPIVKVYQHVSLLYSEDEEGFDDSDIHSIDLMMYKVSENKDISIKKVERLIKESSFDCALNYRRNFISGYDGERECDYMDCDYTCDNIDPSLLSRELNKYEIDNSSYQLYYSDSEIQNIIQKILLLFKTNFHLNFEKIKIECQEYSIFNVITALRTIINNNIVIKNKYGFNSYLKEDNNNFFLIDSLSIIGGFPLEYYTKNPTINVQKTFTNIIDSINETKILDQIDKCCTSLNVEIFSKNISKLSLEIQELFLEYSILSLKKGNQNITVSFVLDYFNEYYIQSEDNTWISWLLLKKYNKIRCLKDEDWEDCTYKYKEYIEKILLEKEEIFKEDLSYYGIISEGKFKIVDVKNEKEEKEEKDRRKKSRGRVCDTIDIVNLVKIIIELEVPIDESDEQYNLLIGTSSYNIWENIQNSKISKSIQKMYSEEEIDQLIANGKIIKLVYLLSKRKIQLCKLLESYFTNNNLIKVE